MNSTTATHGIKAALDTFLDQKLPDLEHAAGRFAVHVKANPWPYTLVGVGLALVAIRSLSTDKSASSTASQVAETVDNRVRHAMDHLKDQASDVKDKAVSTATNLSRKAADFSEKNPLLVGAGIVATRFVAEWVLKKNPQRQAAEAAQAAAESGGIRNDLRAFLRSILNDRA